ncbi:PAS domain S-box protein [Comamonas testosteroni]|uniref:sensor histidine kinase n=1 Tax=Comamonas testosteroni TaxID=285 RepID=UPI0005B37365|nr:PAS domain S-box protein [Comamonas testosteroni]
MSHRAATREFLGARHSAHLKALILVFAICVLGALVLYIWGQLHAQAEQSKSQAMLLARVLEEQTARTLETSELALSSLALSPAMLSRDASDKERQTSLGQVVSQIPFIRSMALLDRRGNVIASTQPGDKGVQVPIDALFAEQIHVPKPGEARLGTLIKGRNLSALSANKQQSPPGISFLPHVLSFLQEDGGSAYLVALINPDAVANFYQATLESLSYEALLMTYGGQPLASTNMGSAIQQAEASNTPVFQQMLLDKERGSYIGRGVLGEQQIVSFRTVRHWPLVLVVEEPYSAVVQHWKDEAFIFFVAGLALLFLVIGLGYSVRKTRKLQNAAQREMDRAQVKLARSEQELAVLMRSVQELIFRTDKDGRLTFVNARWEMLTGQSGKQALGLRLEKIVEPHFRPQVKVLLDAKSQQSLRTCQAQFSLPNGKDILCDIAVVPLTRQGQIIGFAGSAVDVTARWKAQQELQTQLAFQHLLFESTPLPILVTDNAHRITLVNKSWEDFSGLSALQVMGISLKDVCTREDAATQLRANTAVLNSGQHAVLDSKIIHADGTYRDMQITKTAIKDVRGRPTGVLSIFVDVTEFRVAELATREARDAAEEAFRVKSEFVANMSHELRTPLQSIIGFSELGQLRARATPKLSDMFHDIHAAGQRMLALVNDLLDVAKLESPVGSIHTEKTDLRGLIRPVARELEPLLHQKQIDLRLVLEDVPLIAKADPVRFQQVIRNMLANAIKFSPLNGRIDVEGHFDGQGNICVDFCDQGPGIPAHELDKIFHPFVQSSKTKDGSGGTGLGLAICRKIIDAMDGTITASNRPDGGAVFRITLPSRSAQETQPGELI